MSIYTKSGDGGMASTINRRSIPKNAPVFALLGDLDELGSALGVARGKLPAGTQEIVKALQEDLIAFSGEIAGGEKFATGKRIEAMESSIDMMMGAAGQFQGFVLAGGSPGGAALDLARAVARRAERELVACKQTGGISREAMMYLNRFSDLLYALARFTDAGQGQEESMPAAASEEAVTLPETQHPESVPVKASGSPMPQGGLLEKALWLCQQTISHAKIELGIDVVTACCDSGGNPVTLLRPEGALLISIEVAQNKAYTSVILKRTTEELGPLCQPGAPLYGLQNSSNGRIVLFGGGFPMYQKDDLIGGFGISGGTAEQDTELARWARALFEQEGGR